ncbi:hypothetical protein LCGC14_3117840 [marine sediment metagenome]|uniref:Uncharacterized protein n=1 Tax=marine sediment metagenome TaxID=412755 RepID=A0A0F8W3J0_9ZZZZ
MSEPKYEALPPMQSRDDDTVLGVRPLGPPPPMPEPRRERPKGDCGEPWRKTINGDPSLLADNGDIACECSRYHKDKGYAERIVACVNALAGLNPDDVKRRLEERDELLAACKLLIGSNVVVVCPINQDAIPLIRAAIAKAEG